MARNLGLPRTERAAIIRELEQLAIRKARALDGSRRIAITTACVRIYEALSGHHNEATGRTDPGYRALARAASVSLGNVGPTLRRLRAAGYITWRGRFVRAGGTLWRWTHSFSLVPMRSRSTFRAQPKPMHAVPSPAPVDKGLRERAPQAPTRSVRQQLATLPKVTEPEKAAMRELAHRRAVEREAERRRQQAIRWGLVPAL